MRIHRVGTLTFGVTLIVMGILFLIQIIFKDIPLKIILQAWPSVFILLGVEILYANRNVEQQEFLYDKVAILFTMILMCFAMLLTIIGNSIHFSI